MTNSYELLDFLSETAHQYYFASHDHVFTHALLEKRDDKGSVIGTVHQFITPNSAGGSFSRDYAGRFSARKQGTWGSRLYNADAVLNRAESFLVVNATDGGVEVTCHKITSDKGHIVAYTVILGR